MVDGSAAKRTALVAGATGLVGRALLAQLLADDFYERVEVVARRPLTDALARHPRLVVRVGNIAALAGAAPVPSDVYIALGTTIKVAGSQAAFRAVDFDLVVASARAARAAGASRLALVSALGADARSRVFYNRVKGEAETALRALDYTVLVIAQPSLLLGDRAVLGQPTRNAEVLASRLVGPLRRLIPAGVRPIEASAVAAAMIAALQSAEPGVHVLSSAQMQAHAPR